MFYTLFDSTGTISNMEVLIAMCTALVLGFVISYVYMYTGNYTKNFAITVALLPLMVMGVIMMVNGNLGTSVAVLGAFGLVRFRSIPGSSKEIATIFLSMAIGLATGMGYVAFAVVLTIIIGMAMIICMKTNFGEQKTFEKELKITIPENLDYSNIFDDLFEQYTTKSSLERVKTTNMGSMYELHYRIVLKDQTEEKKMIDDIRCRNGNLTIVCGRPVVRNEEL